MNKTPDNYRQFKTSDDLEDKLCLAVLIVARELPFNATTTEAQDWYDNHNGCNDCPLVDRCLTCIINE